MNDKKSSLRDILIEFKEYYTELKQKFFLIFAFILLFSIAGYFYHLYKQDTYIGTISFFVEDETESINLSSISSMANQFGFDLGGGSSSYFSQQNVIELLKSRKIIESTLSQKSIISKKNDKLLHHYISINGIIEDSASIDFNESFLDSITNIIYEEIVTEKLNIISQNDDAGILNLNYTSLNSQFAKIFSEGLIKQMSDMYSEYRTEKTRYSLKNLQSRSDSVFSELKRSERNLAKARDRNIKVVTSSGRLDEIKYMREVQVLNTIYLELVKNLEIVKMTLLEKTPIIQVVDTPTLPLQSEKKPAIFWIFIFSFLGFFITSFVIILRKLFMDVLQQENYK